MSDPLIPWKPRCFLLGDIGSEELDEELCWATFYCDDMSFAWVSEDLCCQVTKESTWIILKALHSKAGL